MSAHIPTRPPPQQSKPPPASINNPFQQPSKQSHSSHVPIKSAHMPTSTMQRDTRVEKPIHRPLPIFRDEEDDSTSDDSDSDVEIIERPRPTPASDMSGIDELIANLNEVQLEPIPFPIEPPVPPMIKSDHVVIPPSTTTTSKPASTTAAPPTTDQVNQHLKKLAEDQYRSLIENGEPEFKNTLKTSLKHLATASTSKSGHNVSLAEQARQLYGPAGSAVAAISPNLPNQITPITSKPVAASTIPPSTLTSTSIEKPSVNNYSKFFPDAPPTTTTKTQPQLPSTSSDQLKDNPYLIQSIPWLESEITKQTAFLTSQASMLQALPDQGATLKKKVTQLKQALTHVKARAETKRQQQEQPPSSSTTSAITPAAGSLTVDLSRLPATAASTSSSAAVPKFGSTPSNAHPMFGSSAHKGGGGVQMLSMETAKDYMISSTSYSKSSARGQQHGYYASSGSAYASPKKDAVNENDLADLLNSFNQFSVTNSSSSSSDSDLVIPGLKSATKLLPHQVQAVRWMSKREEVSSEPRGGLIADDCGLGKTLQMTALILQSMHLEKELPVMAKPKKSSTGSSSTAPSTDLSSYFTSSRATLIICPKAVLNSWRLELEKHLHPGWINPHTGKQLRILTYHDKEKKKWSDSSKLAKSWDIVLTTYETVLRDQSPKAILAAKLKARSKKLNQKKSKNDSSSSSSSSESDSEDEIVDTSFGLMGVYWRRIVLDESHHIRNPQTETCKSLCTLLEGERRWCMSGTPLQNKVDDLYPTFWFLHYEPYATFDRWKSLISKHSQGPRQGLEVLKTLLCVVALRRTKSDKLANGTALIQLPPKTFETHLLEFTPKEKLFYDTLWSGYREEIEKKFGIHRKPGEKSSLGLGENKLKDVLKMSDLLVKLLRLRQTCDHFILAVEGMKQSMRSKKDKEQNSGRSMERSMELACKKIQLKTRQEEKKPQLLNTSSQSEDGNSDSDSDDTCGLCFDPLPTSSSRILTTRCHHSFCLECLKPILEDDDLSDDELECPTCEAPIKRKDFRKKLEEYEKTFASNEANAANKEHLMDYVMTDDSSSVMKDPMNDLLTTTKLSFLINQLHAIKTSPHSATDKVIIFSQWTSMLDIVQLALDREQDRMNQQSHLSASSPRPSFHYVRLDGSQSQKQQHASLLRFTTPTEPSEVPVSIFLISLKAGGTGLNLSCANHVFLMDLWWNPGIEAQAFDRVYRVGQTKPVFIHKLLITGSVEERLYEMQQEKMKLAFGVLDAERKGSGISAMSSDISLGFKKMGSGMTMEDLKEIFLGKETMRNRFR